jgi:hypothetical protein
MFRKESIEHLFEIGVSMVQPYQYRIGKCDRLACFYYFNADNADKYSVRFINLGEIHNKKKQIWQTEFVVPAVEDNKIPVDKKKLYKVISSVIAIAKDFITDNEVDGLNINTVSNYNEHGRGYNLCLNYIGDYLSNFPGWKKKWNPFSKTIFLRKR